MLWIRALRDFGRISILLQIHRLDGETLKEIMKALNDVVESRKVRYVGVSSMVGWEFQALQNVAEMNGWYTLPPLALLSFLPSLF